MRELDGYLHNQDIHEDYRLPAHRCGNCLHGKREEDGRIRCETAKRPLVVAETTHCKSWRPAESR